MNNNNLRKNNDNGEFNNDNDGLYFSSNDQKMQFSERQRDEHLIRNYKKKQKLINEEVEKFSFHPKINSVYQFDQNFAERQIYYNEITEKHKKE